MVFIKENNVEGWDIEGLATGNGESNLVTRWICGVLLVWWILLLISVSGLTAHSWFLLAVGGIGMLQNAYVAGASRRAGAFNIHFEPHKDCPHIIGRSLKKPLRDVPLSKLLGEGESSNLWL
jgi:hypothetical protein